MAKDETTKNGNKTNGDATPTTDEKPKVQLSKEATKKLFDAFAASEKKLNAAKEAVEKAIIERSATVKAIKEQVGQGPFNFGGRVLTVVKRGENYFFKSAGDVIQDIS